MLQEAVQENQGLPVKIVLLPVGSKDTNPAYVYQQSGSVERGRRQRNRTSRDERVHTYFEFLFSLCLYVFSLEKMEKSEMCMLVGSNGILKSISMSAGLNPAT